MKTKYVYPAIFEIEEVGYSVNFPDIEGCYTQGDTLEEAMTNAEDALCLMLYEMEENKQEILEPSSVESVKEILQNGGFVSLIKCDTLEYRRFYSNRAVKKTLSIPAWLNQIAEREGVNFSYILQNALRQTLGIDSK